MPIAFEKYDPSVPDDGASNVGFFSDKSRVLAKLLRKRPDWLLILLSQRGEAMRGTALGSSEDADSRDKPAMIDFR